MAEGNTPSGRSGAGRTESSSAPTDTPARANSGRSTAPTNPQTLGAVDTSANLELNEDDFRKDGTLRAATAREIRENVSDKASSRSYNEVTGKTTVTTAVGGQMVTFEEDGDTRSPHTRRGTDGTIRAFDRAVEADSEGV